MNYPLFVFIINVYNDRLFTQNTQFDALFQQAFCSLHISAVSAVIVRDLLHYFIFALAHVFIFVIFFNNKILMEIVIILEQKEMKLVIFKTIQNNSLYDNKDVYFILMPFRINFFSF